MYVQVLIGTQGPTKGRNCKTYVRSDLARYGE